MDFFRTGSISTCETPHQGFERLGAVVLDADLLLETRSGSCIESDAAHIRRDLVIQGRHRRDDLPAPRHVATRPRGRTSRKSSMLRLLVMSIFRMAGGSSSHSSRPASSGCRNGPGRSCKRHPDGTAPCNQNRKPISLLPPNISGERSHVVLPRHRMTPDQDPA